MEIPLLGVSKTAVGYPGESGGKISIPWNWVILVTHPTSVKLPDMKVILSPIFNMGF